MLMIIMLSLRLMTIPGDDLYHNCRCYHSSLTDVQTAATAVTDHHTDDELVHNVNRVKWHNNCNGDEVDTIVLMKTIKTIYSVWEYTVWVWGGGTGLLTLLFRFRRTPCGNGTTEMM